MPRLRCGDAARSVRLVVGGTTRVRRGPPIVLRPESKSGARIALISSLPGRRGAARPLRPGAGSPPKAGFGVPSATFSTLWQARFRSQHPHQAFCGCREARRRKAAAASGEIPGQVPPHLPQSRKSCRRGCSPCFAAPTTGSGAATSSLVALLRETTRGRRSRERGVAGIVRDGFTRRCRTCTRSSRPGRRRRRRPGKARRL